MYLVGHVYESLCRLPGNVECPDLPLASWSHMWTLQDTEVVLPDPGTPHFTLRVGDFDLAGSIEIVCLRQSPTRIAVLDAETLVALYSSDFSPMDEWRCRFWDLTGSAPGRELVPRICRRINDNEHGSAEKPSFECRHLLLAFAL